MTARRRGDAAALRSTARETRFASASSPSVRRCQKYVRRLFRTVRSGRLASIFLFAEQAAAGIDPAQKFSRPAGDFGVGFVRAFEFEFPGVEQPTALLGRQI